ncbi:MAG: hypothetical protein AAGB51_04785 [Planctomycetota bacterium]
MDRQHAPSFTRIPILITALSVAVAASYGLSASQQPAEQPMGSSQPAQAVALALLPSSHAGAWAGPNRLWVMDPDKPFRSDGTLAVEGDQVTYTWSHKGVGHTGVLRLSGQPAALRGDWTDTWHAKEEMVFHGYQHEGVVRLFGTYPAGDGPDWGWQLQLDARDPEAFVLRMFNVIPGIGPVPAVVLDGTR